MTGLIPVAYYFVSKPGWLRRYEVLVWHTPTANGQCMLGSTAGRRWTRSAAERLGQEWVDGWNRATGASV